MITGPRQFRQYSAWCIYFAPLSEKEIPVLLDLFLLFKRAVLSYPINTWRRMRMFTTWRRDWSGPSISLWTDPGALQLTQGKEALSRNDEWVFLFPLQRWMKGQPPNSHPCYPQRSRSIPAARRHQVEPSPQPVFDQLIHSAALLTPCYLHRWVQ